MSFRSTLALLLAVGLLGLAIWLTDRRGVSADDRARQTQKVMPDALHDVARLQIERGDMCVECVRDGAGWSLAQPVRAPADEGRVRRVLDALEDLPRVEVITPEQRRTRALKLEDYGLAPPRARLAAVGPNQHVELLIGNDAPLGNLTYVRLASEPDVIATSCRIVEALPATVEELRDRALVHGDAARTVRLAIQRPSVGFLQLDRDGNGAWGIQQPVLARADGARIDRLLQALYAARVKRFVWDPPAAPDVSPLPTGTPQHVEETISRADPYGLAADTAAARITVWTKGSETGSEILLGKEAADAPGEIYAKRKDEASILSVDRSLLDAFAVACTDLRDRKAFHLDAADIHYLRFQEGDANLAMEWSDKSGWMLREPVLWSADQPVVDAVVRQLVHLQADSFVSETATNLASFGLQSPPRTITAATDRGTAEAVEKDRLGIKPSAMSSLAATGTCERLLLGAVMTNAPDRFAKMDGYPAVFSLSSDAIQSLDVYPIDPLHFFDRTVLSVSPDAVTRLSLRKGSQEQTVVRSEASQWHPKDLDERIRDARGIEDLLFLVSNMRALRIECCNPESLASYGLDDAPMAVTVGLSGKEGIQKTVMIGYRAKTDGVYGMVQGRNVVFVLGVDVVAQLSRDLVEPAVGTARKP